MKALFNLNNVSLFYNNNPIVEDINISFIEKKVVCVIGPSGSGKSTLLRSLNRMNDLIPAFQCKGEIIFNGHDIYNNNLSVNRLRQHVGMVFQKPCIFPKSIYENVIFGAKHILHKRRKEFHLVVEKTLKSVSLWDEVHNKLHHSALELSQGQQQRLTIARALAVEPTVLLMDEPTSSLDPKSSIAIDDLVKKMSDQVTIIMVTHKLDQAKKVADQVVFMCDGKICEAGSAKQIFENPQKIETRCYVDHDS